jgi:spermidine synthase
MTNKNTSKLVTILDSLTPKVIFKGSTKFNKDIQVIQIGRRKKLLVNGLVQSFSSSSKFAQKRVWGKVTDTIKKEAPKSKRVLILGMGAGTMVHMLNKKFPNTELEITSIEIDQTIVDVANKYFGLKKVTNNRVIVADAYDVVKNPDNYKLTSTPDCIIVDTYCGDEFPNNISLKNLFEIGDKGTFFIFNRIFLDSEIPKLEKYKSELEIFMHPVNVLKINCKGVSNNYLFYGVK